MREVVVWLVVSMVYAAADVGLFFWMDRRKNLNPFLAAAIAIFVVGTFIPYFMFIAAMIRVVRQAFLL